MLTTLVNYLFLGPVNLLIANARLVSTKCASLRFPTTQAMIRLRSKVSRGKRDFRDSVWRIAQSSGARHANGNRRERKPTFAQLKTLDT